MTKGAALVTIRLHGLLVWATGHIAHRSGDLLHLDEGPMANSAATVLTREISIPSRANSEIRRMRAQRCFIAVMIRMARSPCEVDQ